MGEFQKAPSKFSFSLSETRDSVGSLNGGEDEEFYEKIEAPKFVDFSQPDRCSTDDRYWFCLRMGCDRKHEEEMDPEEIYNNFVLRVMAARSPNVRLGKALNSSRRPTKCPLSAPPKSSKPRLSRMALISSFSKKMAEEKVARPLGSTPLTKTKPVSAKYLTTPRNKKCTSDRSLFASAQHQKPVSGEVSTSRAVAKALVFGSPKKANNVKTSSTTPISKLCQGMTRLEIASEGKHVLGYASKSSKSLGSSRKVVKEKPKSLQTCKGQEAKSGRLIRTKNRGQSQQQDSKRLLGSDDSKKPPATKDTEESRIQESSNEEHKQSSQNPNLASADVSEREVKGRNDSTSEATKAEEINLKPQPTSRDDNGNENFTSESCVASADQFKPSNSVEGEQSRKDFDDEDDKENAAASVENRIFGMQDKSDQVTNNALKQTPRKIFGMQDKSDQVGKKVTQAQDNLKETKVKKPKATNPKPFRLRTDERGVLKESTLDKSENANMSVPGGKLQQKQVNDIQKVNTIGVLKTPKGQERSKSASTTLESNKHQERKKTSNAMQRLERFRKLASPLPKHHARPQGLVSRKNEVISYLIPGQKLDVIPEVLQPRSIQKPTGNATPTDDAASKSSSHGGRLITVASQPKFHSTNIPKSCAKKLK